MTLKMLRIELETTSVSHLSHFGMVSSNAFTIALQLHLLGIGIVSFFKFHVFGLFVFSIQYLLILFSSIMDTDGNFLAFWLLLLFS